MVMVCYGYENGYISNGVIQWMQWISNGYGNQLAWFNGYSMVMVTSCGYVMAIARFMVIHQCSWNCLTLFDGSSPASMAVLGLMKFKHRKYRGLLIGFLSHDSSVTTDLAVNLSGKGSHLIQHHAALLTTVGPLFRTPDLGFSFTMPGKCHSWSLPFISVHHCPHPVHGARLWHLFFPHGRSKHHSRPSFLGVIAEHLHGSQPKRVWQSAGFLRQNCLATTCMKKSRARMFRSSSVFSGRAWIWRLGSLLIRWQTLRFFVPAWRSQELVCICLPQ